MRHRLAAAPLVLFTTVASAAALQTAVAPLPAQGVAQPDPDKAYRSATGLLNKGLYDLAAAEFSEFLRERPARAGDDPKVASARYGLAVCLVQLGRHADAAKELDRVVTITGFEFAADAKFLRGQCASATGDDAAAAKWYRTVTTDHQGHALAETATALLGESLYRLGKTTEARAALDAHRKAWPGSPSRHRAGFILALCDVSDGRSEEAAEQLAATRTDKACAAFATQATLLEAQCRHRLGQGERAMALYQSTLDSGDQALAPDALLGLAQLKRQGGDGRAASALLADLIKRFPQSAIAPDAKLEQARVLIDAGEFGSAGSVLDSIASGLPPSLADDAAYWSARCEFKLDKFAQAARRLSAAIAAHPDSPLLADMRFDLAASLGKAGRIEESLAAYDALRASSPAGDLGAESLIASASLEHQRGAFDRSAAACRSFLKDHPSHARTPVMLLLLAENEYLGGRFAAAERDYASLVLSFPNDPQALRATLRRGLCLARLDRFAEAEPLMASALADGDADASKALDPPLRRAALAALGDGCFAASRWADARKWFTPLVSGEGNTDTQVPLLKLGLCLHREGKPGAAIEQYERLIRDYPEGEHLVQAIFEMGQAMYELARPDDAARAFEQVLAAEKPSEAPKFSSHAARYLASIATRRGRPEEAARLLATAAQFSGADPRETAELKFEQALALMSAGSFAEAEAAWDAFVASDASHPRAGEASARRAICIARQGRHDEALRQMELLAGRDAAFPSELRHFLAYEAAWSLRELHRDDEAALAYARLLDSSPGAMLRAHASLDLARLHVAAGRFEAALKVLDAAASPPTPPAGSERPASAAEDAFADRGDIEEQSLYLRGVCENQLGRHAPAARTLKDFALRFPKSTLAPSAGLLRGEALLRAGNPGEAVVELRRVTSSPTAGDSLGPALLRLGEAAAAAQQWTESEEAFGAYLRKFPNAELWFQARFGIGWAQENQGRHDAAIKSYVDVVTRHTGPTAARAQFQIGECCFAQKKFDEAVRELLKTDILYAYPEWSAAALFEAGRCLSEAGKPADGKRQYEDVVRRWPDSQWARLARELLARDAAASVPPSLPGRGGAVPAPSR